MLLVLSSDGRAQSLEARAGAPLYTMYAATPAHTQAELDLTHTLSLRGRPAGLTFGTAEDGFLGYAFRRGYDVRFRPDQFAIQPVVTASYSDMVGYRFEPFGGIEVMATAYVAASAAVLHEVILRNRTNGRVTLDLFPFYERPSGFDDVAADSAGGTIEWAYDVQPDGWTRRYGQSHTVRRRNVMVLDAAPHGFGVYPTRGTLDAEPWAKVASASEGDALVEEGTLLAADGTPCSATPPEARLTLLRTVYPGELLTEELPPTARGANLPGDGTQRLSLDAFDQPAIAPGDSFTVVAECAGQYGRQQARIAAEPAVTPVDVRLSDTAAVPVPINLNLAMAQDGTGAIIRWDEVPEATYRLYRTTPAGAGHYRLVADSLTFAVHYDFGLDPQVEYRYTVIAVDSTGRVSGHAFPVAKPKPPPPPEPAIPFLADVQQGQLSGSIYSYGKEVAAFHRRVVLPAGGEVALRVARVAAPAGANADSLADVAAAVLDIDLKAVAGDREARMLAVVPSSLTGARRLLYVSASNLLRQHHMPAEGDAASPYLIAGRGRSEGWSGAGQSLRESLAALAYSRSEPEAVQAMHRLYFDRQGADGYVPSRVGPRLDMTLLAGGERTSAPPWLSWVAWRLYEAEPDAAFLADAYDAGSAFFDFWRRERDADGDGLSSWGGHRSVESARDGQSVVWQYLGEDDQVEALDLNVMLVQEARALARMAAVLGDGGAEARWENEAAERAERIRTTFWDEETQFFYHVDADDHSFSVRAADDLKRREIIGFLPLWAGIASDAQAAALVDALRDEQAFGRRYGVPSLAADDPAYHAAGRWDGPVWVPWQVFVVDGLQRYGYDDEARDLAERVVEGVDEQLRLTNQFPELYSPDHAWSGHRAPYVGSGLVAMLLDAPVVDQTTAPEPRTRLPLAIDVYPNPFGRRLVVAYSLPEPGPLRLSIYDVLGREVKVLGDGRAAAGVHRRRWAVPDELADGVYIVVIDAGGRSERRSLVHVQ